MAIRQGILGLALVVAVSAVAVPPSYPPLPKYPGNCAYKNLSMDPLCSGDGTRKYMDATKPAADKDCRIKNITSLTQFCDVLFNTYPDAVMLPYMASNFTTPYAEGSVGCPKTGEPHLHIPLRALIKGNPTASTVCTLTCSKKCEALKKVHPMYAKANFFNTMIPSCYCPLSKWGEKKAEAAADAAADVAADAQLANQASE